MNKYDYFKSCNLSYFPPFQEVLLSLRFLIGGNGRVYEGAGWHHVGAHTKDYNKRAVGISFIGDFRCEYNIDTFFTTLKHEKKVL